MYTYDLHRCYIHVHALSATERQRQLICNALKDFIIESCKYTNSFLVQCDCFHWNNIGYFDVKLLLDQRNGWSWWKLKDHHVWACWLWQYFVVLFAHFFFWNNYVCYTHSVLFAWMHFKLYDYEIKAYMRDEGKQFEIEGEGRNGRRGEEVKSRIWIFEKQTSIYPSIYKNQNTFGRSKQCLCVSQFRSTIWQHSWLIPCIANLS